MSIPINDDFLNAIVLTSAVNFVTSSLGFIFGTNISASRQLQEPTPIVDRSVWYVYTAHSASQIAFRTTYNSSAGSASYPPLKSNLSVFEYGDGGVPDTSSLNPFTGLTQSNYVAPYTFTESYAHWEYGSQVIINATGSYNYYIRVADGHPVGVDGQHGGNFVLSWHSPFTTPIFGPCASCGPIFGCGINCSGVLTSSLTFPHSPWLTSYGFKPKGRYMFKYCGGSNVDHIAWPPPPTTYPGEGDYILGTRPFYFFYVSLCGDTFFGVQYTGSSGVVNQTLCNDDDLYWDEASAETRWNCRNVTFNHMGGHIALSNSDVGGAEGSEDGTFSRPATWGLYSLTPCFQITSVCASWITQSAHTAHINYTLYNNNQWDWVLSDNITASVYSHSGSSFISNCTSQSFSVLSAHSVNLSFNMTCSSELAIADLKITSPYFTDVLLPTNLQPLMGANVSSLVKGVGTGNAACTFDFYKVNLNITNSGYFTTQKGSVTCSFDNGLQMFDKSYCPTTCFPNCGNLNSIYMSPATIGLNCNGGVASPDLYVKSPAVTTVAGFTASYMDNSGASFGPFYFPNITVPS